MFTVEPATQNTYRTQSTTQRIRGFAVCSAPGRATRWFMQRTAQKWTPALEQKLKQDAEDWAKVLNSRLPR